MNDYVTKPSARNAYLFRQIVDRVGVSRSTIREVIHDPTTPTKPRSRRLILDTPTHYRFILYATLNARQGRKLWRQIA
ncbi:hypothetical protein K469DRAFT_170512 [Zopfia rhizophila CBS 207.26]|uniref:Uncharacterized protein n=1 Tax=Zopfia rhizophila CBS 207.26 TaxID=1314779 RepID=A0A6A6DZG1_9PEZI|nr:hypothetical protein K469DRAFT_170512 [Zopfia rhizophila CBS 207.26]